MPYVNVPNDLSKIKTKMAFNLTKRQLVCFGIGAAVGIRCIARAKGKNSARAIRKLTEVVDGQLRIISDPPLIVPIRDLVARSSKKKLAERFDEEE